MPYFAPEAAMPITSCAPRLAEMKARPHTQAGMARPARKKSVLVFTRRRKTNPMPSTDAKYTSMITQSIPVRCIALLGLPPKWAAFLRGEPIYRKAPKRARLTAQAAVKPKAGVEDAPFRKRRDERGNLAVSAD